MNLNKGTSAPVAILIIIILAALAGGIAVWQYKEMKETGTPEIEITEDKTADWKTYTNKEYGFKVEYPEDWSPSFSDYGIELRPINKTKPERIFISISASTQRPQDWTLGEWLAQTPNTECDYKKAVNNLEWCVFYRKEFEGVRQDTYGITKSNIDYIARFNVGYGRQRMDYYLSDEELSEEINVFKQILSSFEFLE